MTKRNYDPDDVDLTGLRHWSLSKDWLIGIMTVVIGALLSLGLKNLNDQQSVALEKLSAHGAEIEALKQSAKRLDRIENKLDAVLSAVRS